MITINNKKFARTEEEFTNSLFSSGGTCSGYYRVNKTSVSILDHNKNKIAVVNRHGVICKATKQDNGTWWYSHGAPEVVGKFASYSEEVTTGHNIIDKLIHGVQTP